MIGSMYSAVSGLQSHQTKMDVVGNNIANVNTYGYKANRATFSDIFYSSRRGASAPSGNAGGTNPSQIGYGARVSSIDVIHTRAGAATTSNPFDVYINGDGFIAVMTSEGQARYTRAGVLGLDAEGNLVDRNGNRVLGLPMQKVTLPSGEVEVTAKLDNTGRATIRDLTTIALDPNVQYTGIEIGTKGEVTALRPGVDAFTPGANTGWLKMGTQGTSNSTATENSPLLDNSGLSGDVRISVERISGVVQLTGVYAFDKTGALVNLGGAISSSTPSLTFPSLNTPGTDLLLMEPESAPAFTDYLASLPGIAADGDTRDITIGTIGPGTSIPELLGQIAVLNFQNTSGLSQEGESYFVETLNSGEAEAYVPGSGGTGTLMAGMLEMSNVDLSREFTEMIITERGFQANSRMITVSDEMLQELINMKR
jgi:flagellar hook protein FlgE